MPTVTELIKSTLSELEKDNNAVYSQKRRHKFSICNNISSAKEFIKQTFIESDETVLNFKWEKEYQGVAEWLVNNKGKGLCMIGASGKGKSRIMYSTVPIGMYALSPSRILRPVKAYDLHPSMFRSYLAETTYIAIDEIGREPLANEYGVKYEMLEIVADHCEHYGKLLFLTSNIPYENLVLRYGQPCVDRITKICKTIIFTGETNRNN